ncbi:hypothetical protein vBAfQDWS535_55 [Alcaligenes phage vB_Af_QDWS535]|nr:hypothetical protein vBAfQDWS535_55 [Alcaligenes phage vB_Af_QDWS535]
MKRETYYKQRRNYRVFQAIEAGSDHSIDVPDALEVFEKFTPVYRSSENKWATLMAVWNAYLDSKRGLALQHQVASCRRFIKDRMIHCGKEKK